MMAPLKTCIRHGLPLLTLALALGAAPSASAQTTAHGPDANDEAPTAGTLSVSMAPGKHWSSTMWIGFIPLKKSPQIAVWVETVAGEFVETLSVTASAGNNSWRASPKEGRPEALPVWNHAKAGNASVGGKADSPFAVDVGSSATPTAGLSVARADTALAPGTEYRLRLEVNASFDYNDTWPKSAKKGAPDYSGVNGQPSVVYEAYFVAGVPSSVELKPIGHGSVDGIDGSVIPGLQGLTTAVSILENPTLVVK